MRPSTRESTQATLVHFSLARQSALRSHASSAVRFSSHRLAWQSPSRQLSPDLHSASFLQAVRQRKPSHVASRWTQYCLMHSRPDGQSASAWQLPHGTEQTLPLQTPSGPQSASFLHSPCSVLHRTNAKVWPPGHWPLWLHSARRGTHIFCRHMCPAGHSSSPLQSGESP